MKYGAVLILLAAALAACGTATRPTSDTGIRLGVRALCMEEGTGLVYLRERCDK